MNQPGGPRQGAQNSLRWLYGFIFLVLICCFCYWYFYWYSLADLKTIQLPLESKWIIKEKKIDVIDCYRVDDKNVVTNEIFKTVHIIDVMDVESRQIPLISVEDVGNGVSIKYIDSRCKIHKTLKSYDEYEENSWRNLLQKKNDNGKKKEEENVKTRPSLARVTQKIKEVKDDLLSDDDDYAQDMKNYKEIVKDSKKILEENYKKEKKAKTKRRFAMTKEQILNDIEIPDFDIANDFIFVEEFDMINAISGMLFGYEDAAVVAFNLYGLFGVLLMILGFIKMGEYIPLFWIIIMIILHAFNYDTRLTLSGLLITVMRIMLMNYSPTRNQLSFFTAGIIEILAAVFLYVALENTTFIIVVTFFGCYVFCVMLFYLYGAGISKNLPAYVIRLIITIMIMEIAYVGFIVFLPKFSWLTAYVQTSAFCGPIAVITLNTKMYITGALNFIVERIQASCARNVCTQAEVNQFATRFLTLYAMITFVILFALVMVIFFAIGVLFTTDKRFRFRNLPTNLFMSKAYFGSLIFIENWNLFASTDGPLNILLMTIIIIKYYSILMNPLIIIFYVFTYMLTLIFRSIWDLPVTNPDTIRYEAKMIDKMKVIDIARITQTLNNMVQISHQVGETVFSGKAIMLDNLRLLTAKHVVEGINNNRITINETEYDIAAVEYDTKDGQNDNLAILRLNAPLDYRPIQMSNHISDSLYSRLNLQDANLQEAQVIDFDQLKIEIKNNTRDGDSGTPMVNERGQLIGIHCGSIDERNFILPVWRLEGMTNAQDLRIPSVPDRIFRYFEGVMRSMRTHNETERLQARRSHDGSVRITGIT